MENNFLFIWMYSLQIVKYFFENNKPEEAFKVYSNAASLVADHLPNAYPIALDTLTREQMKVIWDFDNISVSDVNSFEN